MKYHPPRTVVEIPSPLVVGVSRPTPPAEEQGGGEGTPGRPDRGCRGTGPTPSAVPRGGGEGSLQEQRAKSHQPCPAQPRQERQPISRAALVVAACWCCERGGGGRS